MTTYSKDDIRRYKQFRRVRIMNEEPYPDIDEYLRDRASGKIKRGGHFEKMDPDGLTESDRQRIKNTIIKINKKAMGLL